MGLYPWMDGTPKMQDAIFGALEIQETMTLNWLYAKATQQLQTDWS